MKALSIKILGAIVVVVAVFSRSSDARVRVQVINELEIGRRLLVHCRSREDDLQYQTLGAGEAVEWDFNVNFVGTTLFYCDVQWDSSSWYHFHAYDADRDYRRCKSLCRWMISKQGLLYGYDEDIGFWRMFPFNPSIT